MSNKVIKIIDCLESADHDICRLCKRVYPQHKDCISCEQHDERVAIIKAGRSILDWPRVSMKILEEIIALDDREKLWTELRSKGIEIEE